MSGINLQEHLLEWKNITLPGMVSGIQIAILSNDTSLSGNWHEYGNDKSCNNNRHHGVISLENKIKQE